MRNLSSLVVLGLIMSACGGGGGGSSSNPPTTSSSTAVVSSSSSSSTSTTSSSSSSVTTSSSSSSVSVSSSSSSVATSSSSSVAPQVLTIDMTAGWRGNSTGSNANSGVTYNNGVVFTASGDGVGAVFDVLKPTQLEKAVVDMVVNVSSEFKASGANLQIYAQVKNTWAGEWDCWSSNGDLTAGTDSKVTCTISEADNRFNQSANDVQVGIQAKGTPAGTVTIKSAKITLAQTQSSSSSTSSGSTSSYSANVARLRDLATFPIGAAVSNTDSPTYNILTNTSEQAVVEKHFSQMTAGNIMKVSYLHPNNNGNANDFTFANADAFVDYAKSKDIKVHGHALIWHASYQVPNFMKNWAGTSEEFLTMLDNHVTTIVTHYKDLGNVVSWDVVNEALTDGSPSTFRSTDSTFYVKSGNSAVYIERAFKAARLADANVDLYYNDYNIDQNNAKTTKLVEMVADFQARNIPITGVGFQMHVFMDYPSIENIKAAMKKIADKGLKVKISELDVAINNPYSSGWSVSTATQYNNTSALAQKKRYCDIVAGYKEVVPEAQRGGITVWGTTDAGTWLTTATSQYNGQALAWPLLFDNNYNDKPALRGFADGLIGTACTNL
ncbi:endo-1,4-beta-xylanase [Cellvibrio sp.]|uniref:endo-1,4-beta-xylanase n=1 Tax=Cellvibrio sp. TaxID=1965322 RepID=UPI003964798D